MLLHFSSYFYIGLYHVWRYQSPFVIVSPTLFYYSFGFEILFLGSSSFHMPSVFFQMSLWKRKHVFEWQSSHNFVFHDGIGFVFFFLCNFAPLLLSVISNCCELTMWCCFPFFCSQSWMMHYWKCFGTSILVLHHIYHVCHRFVTIDSALRINS